MTTRMLRFAALLACLSALPLCAQVTFEGVQVRLAAPTGSCQEKEPMIRVAAGTIVDTLYQCKQGTWAEVTGKIASGTAALGTSSIASGACASVVSLTATGTNPSKDGIAFSFSSDPTGITGYTPATSGGLMIAAYPTLDHVNFKACNPTSSPITPGPITLNWVVTRWIP